MTCPRCGSELRELLPGARWLRHFLCDDCWSAWHLSKIHVRAVDEATGIRYRKHQTFLERGRNTREQAEPQIEEEKLMDDEAREDPVLRSAMTGKRERLSFRTGS